MPGIFISYRREDSSAYAGRLCDHLANHFGKESVFMDVDSIAPGRDFVEVLQNTVSSCDALVAVIGKQWLGASDAEGRRRLDNPEDLVRLEIAAALDRKVLIIPVLVAGAKMPRAQDLPEALFLFSHRNALEISDLAFHQSVSRLIEVLAKDVNLGRQRTSDKRSGVPAKSVSRSWRFALLGGMAGLLILGFLFYYSKRLYAPSEALLGPANATIPSTAGTDQLRQRWIKRLYNSQRIDSDPEHYMGFMVTVRQGPNSFPDSWVTAQSLKALLMADPDISEGSNRIREAFDWIEKQRFQENSSTSGWKLQATSRRTATYVSAWVVIAYCQALQNGRVWDKSHEPAIVDRTVRLFNEILSWQDPQSGGWGPGIKPTPGNDWSYATALAVWGLVEGYRTPAVRDKLAKRIESATQRGIDWMLRTDRDGMGWEPIPSLLRGEKYRGLDAQMLFVLDQAELTPGVNDFQSNHKFKKAKEDFLNAAEGVVYDEKSAVPPTDSAVDGEFYYGEFLVYPWTLAVLKQLQDDSTLSPTERATATRLQRNLLAQRDALDAKLEGTETYYLAENLIALSYNPRK